MSSNSPTPSPYTLPRLLGAVGLVAVVIVLGALLNFAVNATPTVKTPVSPHTSSTAIPLSAKGLVATPCNTATFGPVLAPLDPPAKIHVYPKEPAMEINLSLLYKVTIATPDGDILLCLEPKLAPHTVNNFVVLTRNGFYNGLIFHRVVAGFVVQGGDPTGTGTGGPGYSFDDEPVQGTYSLGTLAMANSGPNTNGSQFFICIANDSSSLAKSYNLFGHMISGINVAQKIAQGTHMTSVTVQQQTT